MFNGREVPLWRNPETDPPKDSPYTGNILRHHELAIPSLQKADGASPRRGLLRGVLVHSHFRHLQTTVVASHVDTLKSCKRFQRFDIAAMYAKKIWFARGKSLGEFIRTMAPTMATAFKFGYLNHWINACQTPRPLDHGRHRIDWCLPTWWCSGTNNLASCQLL